MSEFHTVKIQFKDKEALIQTLKDMGFEPEVHDEAQNLYGYHGDRRSQKANIIVRRNQISKASNDWGFEKIGNDYQMHISEYDQGIRECGQRIPELKQKYAQNVIQNEVS